jgi:DNA polymerase-3 subunit alpha
MVFPKTMTDHGHKLADDALVIVRGRVDKREDQPKLIAMELDVFEPVSTGVVPLRVKVSPGALSEPLIEQLKGVLTEHPGDSPVFLHLGERQIIRLPEDWNVHAGNGLVAELRVLLGAAAIL